MRAEPFTLVQVVPPGLGGVRDCADCLQAEWQRGGMPSTVLELSKDLARERSLVERIDDIPGAARAASPPPCLSVVLHYSGYGYGQRGLCFWLLDQLRSLRARHRSALQLVVVFHELYASGPPWRSAFWLTPAQAWLAARLARAADALWTNSEHHAQWLRQKVPAKVPLQMRPVFSNVGEPDRLPAWTDRLPQAVVFGSASTRQRAFDALHSHEGLLRRFGVEAIVEVGPGAASTRGTATLQHHHLGRLDTEALGRLLFASQVGLLDYPSTLLGKSGVLAAYAAHGCAVLNTRPCGPGADGLEAGRDYLTLQTLAASDSARLETLSVSLSTWYADHRLVQQARKLMTLCRG